VERTLSTLRYGVVDDSLSTGENTECMVGVHQTMVVKPKQYKVKCFHRTEPFPYTKCPNCGTEGQMVICDEMGETRMCANCDYTTDTHEAIEQYYNYHKK